jgi:hypothetical protein
VYGFFIAFSDEALTIPVSHFPKLTQSWGWQKNRDCKGKSTLIRNRLLHTEKIHKWFGVQYKQFQRVIENSFYLPSSKTWHI